MKELFKDLFIFEMANNHQGSVEHGLEIINAMGKIVRKDKIRGAVKFQYRDLDSLIHPDFAKRNDVKHIPRFLSTRLSKDEFLTLVNAVRDQGLITICSPFDEPSVSLLLDHGIQIIKIASCCAKDWPLLEVIAKTKRPVICSTGGLTLYDIDNIVSFFTHRNVDFALLHCVSLYPVPNHEVQLNFMERMIRRYPYVPVGYSGHESPNNLDVVKIAIAKGATILERHVGIEKDDIKLNTYSMNPSQTDTWIRSALSAKKICGNESHDKRITQAESESLLSLIRGVYALKDIKKGSNIKRRAVFFAMPCQEGQITSGEFSENLVASKNYHKNDPINESIEKMRQSNVIHMIRGIIHDAKGLLYEAHIEVGSDFEIELSHHYGMEHFRQFGALIVNVINREYCKKLIVVLPGQQHPNHYHKIKEETFQLLWGDADFIINGIKHELKPGDKILVERGAWHSFTSQNGAIIEEISTTHVSGDSYYEDPKIIKDDPIKRKTILKEW